PSVARLRPDPSSRTTHSFANPDLGCDGFAGAQLVVIVGPRIQIDFHGNALHYFDVVASRIFGWQKAEARAACPGDAVNFAIVLAAVGVDFDSDTLIGAHIAELRLFEVGGDPHVVEVDDLHEFLPGRDVLADFDGAVADYAIHRRDHFGVLQVEFRLLETRFGA